MEAKNTIVFDIIGTSFSLGNVQRALTRAGAPEPTLPLWFAQSLRDAFALSQAGGYQPLKSILQAELPRTLGQLGAAIPPDQVEQVLAAFGQLEPQPGLTELIPALAGRGWRLLALTNSSVDSVRALLQRTGLLGHFAALLSTDQVRKMKPHPDVYELARREAQARSGCLLPMPGTSRERSRLASARSSSAGSRAGTSTSTRSPTSPSPNWATS